MTLSDRWMLLLLTPIAPPSVLMAFLFLVGRPAQEVFATGATAFVAGCVLGLFFFILASID